jgi:hypothetical protein
MVSTIAHHFLAPFTKEWNSKNKKLDIISSSSPSPFLHRKSAPTLSINHDVVDSSRFTIWTTTAQGPVTQQILARLATNHQPAHNHQTSGAPAPPPETSLVSVNMNTLPASVRAFLVAAATCSDLQLLDLLFRIGSNNVTQYVSPDFFERPSNLHALRRCVKMMALRYREISGLYSQLIADDIMPTLVPNNLVFKANLDVSTYLRLLLSNPESRSVFPLAIEPNRQAPNANQEQDIVEFVRSVPQVKILSADFDFSATSTYPQREQNPESIQQAGNSWLKGNGRVINKTLLSKRSSTESQKSWKALSLIPSRTKKSVPKTVEAPAEEWFAAQPDTAGFVVAPQDLDATSFASSVLSFPVRQNPINIGHREGKGINGRHRLGECESSCPCFPSRVSHAIGQEHNLYVDIKGPGGIVFNHLTKTVKIHSQEYICSANDRYHKVKGPLVDHCIFEVDLRPFKFPLIVHSSAPLTELIRDVKYSFYVDPTIPKADITDHPRGNCYHRVNNSFGVFAILEDIVDPIIHPEELPYIGNDPTSFSGVRKLDIGAAEPFELHSNVPYFFDEVEKWEACDEAPRNHARPRLPEEPFYVDSVYMIEEPGQHPYYADRTILLPELRELARPYVPDDSPDGSYDPSFTIDIVEVFRARYPLIYRQNQLGIYPRILHANDEPEPFLGREIRNWAKEPCLCRREGPDHCLHCWGVREYTRQAPRIVKWLHEMESSWVDLKWAGEQAVNDAREMLEHCSVTPTRPIVHRFQYEPVQTLTKDTIVFDIDEPSSLDEQNAQTWGSTTITFDYGSKTKSQATVSTIIFSDDDDDDDFIESENIEKTRMELFNEYYDNLVETENEDSDKLVILRKSKTPCKPKVQPRGRPGSIDDETARVPQWETLRLHEIRWLRAADPTNGGCDVWGGLTLGVSKFEHINPDPIQIEFVRNAGHVIHNYFGDNDFLSLFGAGVGYLYPDSPEFESEKYKFCWRTDLRRYGVNLIVRSTYPIYAVSFTHGSKTEKRVVSCSYLR